jgi:hypothetical protein
MTIPKIKTRLYSKRAMSPRLALLDLVGKMYSEIQSCWRGSGGNHRDTEDTKIDRSYSNTISLNENYTSNLNPPLSSPF